MEHFDKIIALENGWHPLMVFAVENDDPTIKEFTGLVLAQRVGPSGNPDKWCVWDIYRDKEFEGWDSSTGDYFSDKSQAEYMFGLRLRRRTLPNRVAEGVDRA